MTADKLACSQRHRNAGEHERHQRGQAEEVFRTLHRLAYFGSGIAHIFEFFTRLEAFFYPQTKAFDLLVFTRHQQAVTDAAAFLHQSGGKQVANIDLYARRDTGKADCLVHIF
jgi:hypothetical protein